MLHVLFWFVCFTAAESTNVAIDVNETQMFHFEVRPELFNWTDNGADTTFLYTPSLQNYPDLPPWIHYKFNNKNRHGYLYGTPPVASSERQIQGKTSFNINSDHSEVEQKILEKWILEKNVDIHLSLWLDIIGLNKKTYQVAKEVIQLNIIKKSEFAKYEIRFKINNLNVEDMFQEERILNLLDIFRQNLWLSSKHNLYVTFLASASDLGQRLPLDPSDKEGVVVNLGSESNFSAILFDLEKEISPLQKMNKCPKDFKRTTVERYFRANGFNLDWCSFKLKMSHADLFSNYLNKVELKIINQAHNLNVKDETISPKYTEEKNWEFMESQQFSWTKHSDITNTFNIIVLICTFIVFGIILGFCVFKWYIKKKVVFTKI